MLASKGAISIPELTQYNYDSYPVDEGHWLEDIECDTSMVKDTDDVPLFTLQLKHFVDVIQGTVQLSCSWLEGLKDVLVLKAVKKPMWCQLPVVVVDA
jgi:hypothetical protein